MLVYLRPSVEYFNLTRPVRPEGAPQRRGLFGGARPAAGTRPAGRGFGAPGRTGTTTAAKAPATVHADPARSRSKQRASADSVAKGAELARARAKASKSRRTGA